MVSDWMMPGFGGLQALEMLAARAVDLPCIVISGTPNEEAAVVALRAGALDFLSKDSLGGSCPRSARAARVGGSPCACGRRELRLTEARYRTRSSPHPSRCSPRSHLRPRARGEPRGAAAAGSHGRGAAREHARRIVSGAASNGRDSVEAGREIIERVLAGHDVSAHDWEFIDGAGEVIPVELRLARMPSDHTKLLRVTILDSARAAAHRGG